MGFSFEVEVARALDLASDTAAVDVEVVASQVDTIGRPSSCNDDVASALDRQATRPTDIVVAKVDRSSASRADSRSRLSSNSVLAVAREARDSLGSSGSLLFPSASFEFSEKAFSGWRNRRPFGHRWFIVGSNGVANPRLLLQRFCRHLHAHGSFGDSGPLHGPTCFGLSFGPPGGLNPDMTRTTPAVGGDNAFGLGLDGAAMRADDSETTGSGGALLGGGWRVAVGQNKTRPEDEPPASYWLKI